MLTNLDRLLIYKKVNGTRKLTSRQERRMRHKFNKNNAYMLRVGGN